jgi:hypothetical protein
VKFEKFLHLIKGLKSVDDLPPIQSILERWSLPLPLFANLQESSPGLRTSVSSDTSEQLETTVAFLKFDIDGEPAKHWNYLKPRTSYDLTIEVRVSNWPQGAQTLSLSPVTIEERERDWLPSFSFNKPKGDGPFTLTGTRRAYLEIAQSFGSRPYEFLYAAEFDDSCNCKDIAIIGHRKLLLEGCDIASSPLTGFSNVDRHLLSIRDKLRTISGVNSDDLANTMVMLGGLGNIAAQALKANLFESGTSEKTFQKKVAEMLRNRPDIGQHLQGHQEASGGYTDLTFRDITLELKVESRNSLLPKDCSKFFNQTAAYAIGLGKLISVLAVLEDSPKSAPVGIIENEIEVFVHPAEQSSVAIVVVIVRGGFPTPSSYSK